MFDNEVIIMKLKISSLNTSNKLIVN